MSKPTKWPVRPGQTQISVGIRPVWSESSLSACKSSGSFATHWAHSEDSDQTGLMSRLIWVFAMRTSFVGLVMRRLISEFTAKHVDPDQAFRGVCLGFAPFVKVQCMGRKAWIVDLMPHYHKWLLSIGIANEVQRSCNRIQMCHSCLQ